MYRGGALSAEESRSVRIRLLVVLLSHFLGVCPSLGELWAAIVTLIGTVLGTDAAIIGSQEAYMKGALSTFEACLRVEQNTAP